MPIEIREVVIRASVTKQIRNSDEDPVLLKDFGRIRRDLVEEIMSRVETYVRNYRDIR
jgi:Family of unknown function (DUF5908)